MFVCADVSTDFNAGGGRVNIDSISVGWILSEALRSVEPLGVGGGFGRGIIGRSKEKR